MMKNYKILNIQTFSFQRQWNGCIYKEDHNGSSKDKTTFMMRRPSTRFLLIGQTRNQQLQCEAEVFFNHHPEPESSDQSSRTISSQQPDYKIEGSFWNRNCKIMSTACGEVAAKIIRKRAGAPAMASGSTMVLSEEVFSLVVNPGFDPELIMAFVVILDRICFKPIFTPFMCS